MSTCETHTGKYSFVTEAEQRWVAPVTKHTKVPVVSTDYYLHTHTHTHTH